MPEITAKLVNDLRAKTGQPMMECKKMLEKTSGDLDAAIDEFRKKGMKASILERAATEGRIAGAVSDDRKSGAVVELNCNTDFTAKSDPFTTLGRKAAQSLLSNPSAGLSDHSQIRDGVTQVSQQTGENIKIGKSGHLAAPAGRVGLYIYGITGKIGVLMSFTGSPSDELITDLGGHIAFSRPLALTRDAIPANVVEKERSIAVEQAKATGKPQNIAEKIAEGKLNAFFKEQTLLDQDFFNAQKFKGSIAQLLKQNNVTLDKYVRLEVGQ
jgi:elongation factor Ts